MSAVDFLSGISTAVYAKAMSNATLVSLIGAKFYKKIPQDATPPYVKYAVYGGPKRPWFEVINVDMTVISENNSATEAQTIFAALDSCFDDCDLPANSNLPLNIGLERISSPREYQDDNNIIWHVLGEYQTWIQRDKP